MKSRRGFTLLELMVVVTILAVLGTIAVVSYKYYIRRARLTEGKELLMDVKMKQEQYFSTYSQYVSSGASDAEDWFPTTADPAEPLKWLWSFNCATVGEGDPARGWCDLGFKPSNSSWFQLFTVGWRSQSPPNPSASQFGFPKELNTGKRWFYGAARARFDNEQEYIYVMTSQSSEIVEIVNKLK